MSPECEAVLCFEKLKEKIMTPKSEAVHLVCNTDIKRSNTNGGIT
jgi:hypothetical protein